MSVGDALSAVLATEKSVTVVVATALSLVLIFFLKKNSLLGKYGLSQPVLSARSMLYYLPILAMLTANFWCGVSLNYSVLETILYIFTMMCVGFLEEVIFRGLLFEAMRKESLKTAVIVSSVTFGAGHIVNVLNGSGMELVSNLLQIVYATAAGFMFVMIYLRSKSLIVPIVAHGIFNATSAFANEASVAVEIRVISAVLLTVITGGYAIFLALTAKDSVADASGKSEEDI